MTTAGADTGREIFLRRAIALSHAARAAGNHPFGALLVLDGRVVVEAQNTVITDGSPLGHAESSLMAAATRRYTRDVLARAVMYTSCEPCAMCVGAMYWGGVRGLVYALPTGELAALAGGDFPVPCRDLLSRASQPVLIVGPLLVDEARAAHVGYWESLRKTGRP